MPTDFVGLFAILAAARVRFVLVDGLALVLHGLDRRRPCRPSQQPDT